MLVKTKNHQELAYGTMAIYFQNVRFNNQKISNLDLCHENIGSYAGYCGGETLDREQS
jgi:hypothetical protein